MTIEDPNAPADAGGDSLSMPETGGESSDPFDQATLDAIYDELTKDDAETPLAPVDKSSKKPPAEAAEAKEGDEPNTDSADGEKAPDAPATEQADQPEKEADEPQDTAAIAAPNSWSAEMKEKWGDVPPDVQTYIAQRDSESHSEISRLGREIAQFKPIGELLSTKQDVFDRHGLTPSDGVKTLLDAQERLDADPVNALAAIAESFGIDLAATFGGLDTSQVTDANAQQVFNDLQSQNQQLASQNRQLQQQLAQEQNRVTAKQAREAEIARQEANDAVSKFAEGKPHFDKVRGAMGVLLQQNPAATLDELYEMACYADPEVRQTILAEQQAKASEQQRAEQGKTAADAKRQTPVNTKARRSAPVKSNSWDDDAALSDVYDRIVSNG